MKTALTSVLLTLLAAACSGEKPVPATPTTTVAQAQSTCPAPRVMKDTCVALETYVKVGTECCAYASPCVAPDGPKFNDAKCTDPRP